MIMWVRLYMKDELIKVETKKFAFVILHFLDFEITVSCIETIRKKINYNDYVIIVVDNGSPNKTGEKIKHRYEKDSSIYVILLPYNVGFAKGNNAGFRYAKEKLKCQYICVLNNDVFIEQTDFCSVCDNIYTKNHFAVIGPQIELANGKIQPVRKKLESVSYFKIVRLELVLELFLFNKGIDIFHYIQILSKLMKNKKIGRDTENGTFQIDTVLHGCCWVFTPLFVNKFDGLIDKTFLYREEELLSVLLLNNQMHSAYCTDIKVKHLEDCATNMLKQNKREKIIFKVENEIDSLTILIKEMEKCSL